MLGYALGVVVLLLRPSWVFLFAFTAALAAFPFVGLLMNGADPLVAVLAGAVNGGVFFLIGGAIVAIRLWLRSRGTPAEKDIDAELARIRAEAAAREAAQQQPPPQA